MMSSIARFALASWLVLALSGCEVRVVESEIRDVATYYNDARRTPEDGAPVALTGSYDAAFARAVDKLRSRDFQVVTADAAQGLIIARSTDRDLLACGELQSGPLSEAAVYDANTPMAIIEIAAAGGGATFVRREFSSASEITIRISTDPARDNRVFASISETHNATIRLTQLTDGSVLYAQTIAFDGVNRGRFDRGVICGSARAVRAIIR